MANRNQHDPGDAVPPGVAPVEPPPPSEEDKAVLEKLRRIGGSGDRPSAADTDSARK